MKVRILGAGRAGRSFARALAEVGVEVELLSGRPGRDGLAGAARGTDGLLLAVPDRHVEEVSSLVEKGDAVVLHCSGSLGLDVLGAHERRASLHPLATLPDPVVGALRLRGGIFFAVEGDPLAAELALLLGGRPIIVAKESRVLYHAAATVAANHLVGLLGQVERLAALAGLPLEAFLPLARGALDDVSMLGPASALTGPAARGDGATLAAHRAALPDDELAAYDAGVETARRLVEQVSAASAT